MSVDRHVAGSNPPAALTRAPVNSIPKRRGFPVQVIEDAADGREVEQMPAGEISFHRDTA
jgi:hypothetical protein